MRLPSISLPWGSNRQDLHSVDPVGVTGGLDKRESYGQVEPQEAFLVQTEPNHWCALPRTMFSSPLVPTPLNSPIPVQLTSSSVDQRSSSRSVLSLHYLSGMYIQHHQPGDKLQQARCVEPWERTDYSQARGNAGFGQLIDEHYFSNSQFLSRTVPYETLHSENSRPHRRSESLTALNPYQMLIVFGPASAPEPTVLGSHYSMPIGQPAVHKSPPSLIPLRKRSRKPSIAPMKIDKRGKDNSTSEKSEDAQDNLTAVDRSNTSQRNIVPNQQRLEWGGPFIHRPCGKGFASRAKVKKHHWGDRYDDLNTTTGCWFKHKKPNIKWNDHPSCKEELPTSTTLKTTQAESTSVNHKATKHATIMPRDQFHSRSTLQNASQAFAAAHKSSHTLSPYLQDCSAQNNVKQDGLLPYHTESLTSKSPLENLLTAVNVAAKIEAPVPKGQSDSVVSRLDAQALTTERNEQHLPVWAPSPRPLVVDHGQRYLLSHASDGKDRAVPFSGLPLLRNGGCSSQNDSHKYKSSTRSHVVHNERFRNPLGFTKSNRGDMVDQGYCLYSLQDREPVSSSSTSPGLEGEHKDQATMVHNSFMETGE